MFNFGMPTRHFETINPILPAQVLHLEPPALRVVRDLNSEQDLDGIINTVSEILSRNKEGATITPDDILEHVTYDQIRDFIVAFRGWLVSTRESDPN